MAATDKALMQELLCIADTDWVLGHWYIKVMLNGRSLPDCTAFAGMGRDRGHTRAIFVYWRIDSTCPNISWSLGASPRRSTT